MTSKKGSKITIEHFKQFDLTVHKGNNKTKEPSKIEAMFFLKPLEETDPEKTKGIILNGDGDCFTFTRKFKYHRKKTAKFSR